ncbi:MAG: carboxypeptidase-like regulatory domain-containing protein [Phycisphaerales bacterium]
MMNLRIHRWALGICVVSLFILLLVGIGFVFESHTFRASANGRITDTEGNPIAGVKVEYCLPNAPGDTIKYDMSSRTDSEGKYSMSLPGFTVALDTSPDYLRQVRISADGYASFCAFKTLKKGHNSDCNYILATDAESVR